MLALVERARNSASGGSLDVLNLVSMGVSSAGVMVS
jgi:hypothetical protein